MLVVNFGVCSDEEEKIRKSFSSVKTCNCEVYGESSILKPNLLLRYDAALTSCNYAFIGEWGRYYWIKNSIVANGGRLIISCEVDPLKSFDTAILNLDVKHLSPFGALLPHPGKVINIVSAVFFYI